MEDRRLRSRLSLVSNTFTNLGKPEAIMFTEHRVVQGRAQGETPDNFPP